MRVGPESVRQTEVMISMVQILTTRVSINNAGSRRAPPAQPVSYPSLIATNLSHSNRATTPPSLDDSCVFICLSVIKGKSHRTEKKNPTLTHHLQGCYLAGGQEEERVTGVPTSEWSRDELPQPFFPSHFYSSFPFILSLPLTLPTGPHTKMYQEVSCFR